MKLLYLFLIYSIHLICLVENADGNFPRKKEMKVYYELDEKKLFVPESESDQLNIFCRKGEERHISTLLKTVEASLEIKSEDYKYYQANHWVEVSSLHEESLWFSFYPWKPKVFRMDIHNISCVGINTRHSYNMVLRVRYVDIWRIIGLAVGFVVFLSAPMLAKNVVFHYSTGVAFGIFASTLVLAFILSRYIPKKSGAMVFFLGGFGMSVYLAQYLWEHCIKLVNEHLNIVIGYIAVSGVISFLLVYRYGPMTDVRSITIVQWFLQGFSLLLIFFSSQFREATLALVILLVSYYNVPQCVTAFFKRIWVRFFPPQVKMLTQQEYVEQGVKETEKALKELREYCRSPKCNAWKTIRKIESPIRFAEFIDGGSHVADDELMSYDALFSTDGELTSDEDDD